MGNASPVSLSSLGHIPLIKNKTTSSPLVASRSEGRGEDDVQHQGRIRAHWQAQTIPHPTPSECVGGDGFARPTCHNGLDNNSGGQILETVIVAKWPSKMIDTIAQEPDKLFWMPLLSTSRALNHQSYKASVSPRLQGKHHSSHGSANIGSRRPHYGGPASEAKQIGEPQ